MEFVTIKDEEFVRDTLLKSIVKIEIDKIEDANIVIRIRLDDSTVTSPITIKKINLVSILNAEIKKEILEYAITNIKLSNLEQDEKTIEISGPGYVWLNHTATDDDIFEMFEVKK